MCEQEGGNISWSYQGGAVLEGGGAGGREEGLRVVTERGRGRRGGWSGRALNMRGAWRREHEGKRRRGSKIAVCLGESARSVRSGACGGGSGGSKASRERGGVEGAAGEPGTRVTSRSGSRSGWGCCVKGGGGVSRGGRERRGGRHARARAQASRGAPPTWCPQLRHARLKVQQARGLRVGHKVPRRVAVAAAAVLGRAGAVVGSDGGGGGLSTGAAAAARATLPHSSPAHTPPSAYQCAHEPCE